MLYWLLLLIIKDSDLVDYQSQITGREGLFVQYIPQDVYPYSEMSNWGNLIASVPVKWLKYITLCQTTTEHNKVLIICTFHGMYCIPVIECVMKTILCLCIS